MTIEQIAHQIILSENPDRPILIAIEGFGGSGKSTFAKKLADMLGDAYVLHVDDFIVKEKLAATSWESGIFDLTRLENEVLLPIASGNTASFRKLLWSENTLSEPITIPHATYLLIEGICAYHPTIERYYAFKIWVDTPIEIAKSRGHARGGSIENAAYWDQWEANDIAYKDSIHPDTRADFIYKN